MSHRVIPFIWLIIVFNMPAFAEGGQDATPESPLETSGYHWVAGVIDIRSTISDGSHTPDFLADLAHQRGIGILLLSDHERMAVEYGVFPFRKFLKHTKELPSVNTFGWNQYQASIEKANRRHDDVLLIPGVESSPFYYWSGLPFIQGGLTLHNWERHLLVFDLETNQDYTSLPSVGNNYGFSWQGQPTVLILFAGVMLLGLIQSRWKGWQGKSGIILAVLALAGGIDALRLGPSRYDQYHGDQGMAPYQDFIDQITARGGLVFWNHPGTNSGKRPLPPIQLDTPPYPEVVTESRNYTGIAVLSGESFADADPGGRWDQVLNAYCLGQRQRPVWGIATADFHQNGTNGERLGDYSTVFAVRSLKKKDVLDALNNGRMYAVKGPLVRQDRLTTFAITNALGTKRAISGEEIELSGGRGWIEITIESPNAAISSVETGSPLTLRVIENGHVVTTSINTSPAQLHLEIHPPADRKSYYRLDISGNDCRTLSNPIFTRPTAAHPDDHNI